MSCSVSTIVLGVQIADLRAVPALQQGRAIDRAGSACRQLVFDWAALGPKGPRTSNLVDLGTRKIKSVPVLHDPPIALEDR
jgi:hypothetical protein